MKLTKEQAELFCWSYIQGYRDAINALKSSIPDEKQLVKKMLEKCEASDEVSR